MEADAAGKTTTYHEKKQAGTVDLVIWSGGARGATWIKYTSSGSRNQIAKLNQHCLGCHSAGGATSKPFNDGKTPQQYAWDARSVGERYTTTATTAWGKYNSTTLPVNQKDRLPKALSAHGYAAGNKMGWNSTNGVDGAITDITSNINVNCFDCHNSHGSNTVGKTVSYTTMSSSKYNGGIFKNTTSTVGGYSVSYKASSGTAGAKTSYNPGADICFDCHNTKTASVGKKPWGYNSTFNATQALFGYWDTPYFGNYTFASTKRFSYKSGNANAKAINAGGHFGASKTLNHTPTALIGGLCTPCHDPHGVTNNTTYVNNQANAVPLLKGTWVTSPYREDRAPSTTNVLRGGGSKQTAMPGASNAEYSIDQNTLQANRATTTQASGTNVPFGVFGTAASTSQTLADTDFAGLCTRCHTKSLIVYPSNTTASAGNWKKMRRVHQTVEGWAATSGTGGNVNNSKHAYTCSKCHAVHNYRLPRLLVTNCLDVKHRGRVVSGGSVATAPSNGATTAGNQISTTNSTGQGAGRFPAGGGRFRGTKGIGTSSGTARFPGPWLFGTTQTGSAAGSYTTSCHNSGTAGGATYTPANQLWNTTSPW
jgi:hypothetical protein